MLKKILLFTLIIFCLSLVSFPAQATYTSNSLKAGTLIKSSTDSVYYYGADGQRYVFPNEKTYKTWFVDFNMVISISDELLGDIKMGGIITYRPNMRLVKVTTDPKVYWVDKQGTLRPISSEELANELFGYNWKYQVDDIPDTFFEFYVIGMPLTEPTLPAIETSYSINNDKLLSSDADPSLNELGMIDLTGSVSGTTANLKWSVKNFNSAKGFKVVKSNEPDPVYPGDAFHYLSDPNARSDSWTNLNGGTYYFRVCEYLDGACGIYSKNLVLTIARSTDDTYYGDKKITLKASDSGTTANLNWDLNFNSTNGFKVVKSTSPNPVYPGDTYHYLSSSEKRSDTWTGLTPSTYHFRVCEYLGNGVCGIYSNDVAVTIEGQIITDPNISINLTGYYDEGYNKVILTWQANSSLYKGVKVVKSTTPNPVYPGNDYHYLSDPKILNEYSQDPPGGTDYWKDLAPGTYHFRVCDYQGNGVCGTYSNDVAITVTGEVVDNSNGSINLTGWYDESYGKVRLEWSLTELYSAKGFKVVYSTSPNPVYPGNEYHYLSSPEVRTDYWAGLVPGTYHFRTCEYLGNGVCGAYSNDVSVIVY